MMSPTIESYLRGIFGLTDAWRIEHVMLFPDRSVMIATRHATGVENHLSVKLTEGYGKLYQMLFDSRGALAS